MTCFRVIECTLCRNTKEMFRSNGRPHTIAFLPFQVKLRCRAFKRSTVSFLSLIMKGRMQMEEQEKIESTQSDETALAEVSSEQITSLVTFDDPEIRLARIEKTAELAERFENALQTILIASTHPQDWEGFGEGEKRKYCLSSAGAERVAKHFPIQIYNVKHERQEWERTSDIDEGYRHIFSCDARMGDRVIHSEGVYSTRDKFLGFNSGDYRPLSEINENDIRRAAYHITLGNAFKAMLGLRAMPEDVYQRLMSKTGRDPKKSTSHEYGKGTRGGKQEGDAQKQKELAEMCLVLASSEWWVERDGKKLKLCQIPFDIEPQIESNKPNVNAVLICKIISSFVGNDKKVVDGRAAAELSGQRLSISHKSATALIEELKTKKD